MKYTHYLFIFLNGTIVYGVGEALIVCFAFFFLLFFLEEDDKTIISSWSCLIRASNSYMVLKREGNLGGVIKTEGRRRLSFLQSVWEIKINSNCTLYRQKDRLQGSDF